MKKTLIALCATAGVVAGVSAASAATTNETSTGQLTVRATLKEGCNINFGDDVVVDFGVISALSRDMPLQRSFTLGCSNLSGQTNTYEAASVALNKGDVSGSTVANRLLGFGSSTLAFQVYQGSTGETVWGDGSSTSAPVYPTPIANGESDTFQFRVVLLAQDLSDKVPGTYKNTMIATVNFTANDGV